MRFVRWAAASCRWMALLAVVAPCSATLAAGYSFVKVDLPGSPAGIDSSGTIAGTYVSSADNLVRGFVRHPSGALDAVSVPNATRTDVFGINDYGQVVGSTGTKGFIRDFMGFVTVDHPPSGTVTEVRAISNGGVMAGSFGGYQTGWAWMPWKYSWGVCTSGCAYSGDFLTDPTRFVDIAVPSGVSNASPTGIAGSRLVGQYYDRASASYVSFVVDGDTFSVLEVPGCTGAGVLGINDSGTMVGGCKTGSGASTVSHGFVGSPTRGFALVDYPGASGTMVAGISRTGLLVGAYSMADGSYGYYVASPAVNRAPVVAAFPAQTATQGTPWQLDLGAFASDPDGDPLVYALAQEAPAGATIGSTSGIVSWTPAASGTFTLSGTVSDGSIATAFSVEVVVRAAAANLAPVANAGAPQTVRESTTVALDGSASSDPDGSIVSYAWTQTSGPTVTLAGASTAHPTFTAPAVAHGSTPLTFQLTVTDDGGAAASASVTITAAHDASDKSGGCSSGAGIDLVGLCALVSVAVRRRRRLTVAAL